MKRILIIEDDITFSIMLQTYLNKNGFDAECVSSVTDARKKLTEINYNAVLSDLRLQDHDGIEILKWAKKKGLSAPVIIMTSYADIQTAVEAIKLGAYDYIAKPVNPDELLKKINEATKPDDSGTDKPTLANDMHIQGESEKAKILHEYIRLVAPTNMSILINGASGTGKEYVAKLIHKQSSRNNKPFVAVDCGAIPRELAASELFGHVKGSFTGAISDKTGHFLSANGGTLFLDEIGNLPYDIQVQLLRALQEKTIKPVGSSTDVKVDVRIIAATNEDLHKAINQGNFREDLYHRINEFSLYVPTLKERESDIIIFANHFLNIANEELGKNIVGFDNEVICSLLKYDWPGNLRQMKNAIKRATLLAKDSLIHTSELPSEIIEEKNDKQPESLKDAEHEKRLILNALKTTNNNKTQAAALLKIDRKTLYNKIKLYNIE